MKTKSFIAAKRHFIARSTFIGCAAALLLPLLLLPAGCDDKEKEKEKEKDATVAVTGVTVSPTDTTLAVNATFTFTAIVTPDNATDKSVTWTSSSDAIATVTTAGVVKAIAPGPATITVTTTDGGHTATVAVTVNDPAAPPVAVTGVTVSPTDTTLAVNATFTFTAIVTPDNATDKSVTWTSSSDAIATVTTAGVVKAVAPGTAVITATANDGSGATGAATVTVEPVTPPASLKILGIGNSFTQDGMEYLPHLLKSAGITNVTLGKLTRGGATLKDHYDHHMANESPYDYSKSTGGNSWQGQGSSTFKNAVENEPWDIIIIQQYSGDAGKYNTYQPYLNSLIPVMVENCSNPNVRIGWQMTWAYGNDNPWLTDYGYGGSQETMYNAIAGAVQAMIGAVPEITEDLVIPSGTAIQNLRGTHLNNPPKDLTRDNSSHLDEGVGRYTAACAWFQTLIAPRYGISALGNTYTNNSGSVPANATNTPLCQEAAVQACINKWEVSEIASALVSSTSIAVAATAGAYPINVTSKAAWMATLSGGAAWCTLTNTSGTGNGTVTVNVAENASEAPRAATVTVTAGTLTADVTVTQAAKAAAPPPHAASTTTWTFGAQQWSDAINIPDCNKSEFTDSPNTPSCRSFNGTGTNGATYYYYNWAYVNANKDALCPAPWRVPTKGDLDAVVASATASVLLQQWPKRGWVNSSVDPCCPNVVREWSQTEDSGSNAWAFYDDNYDIGSRGKNFGFAVRCVK